MKKFLSMIGVMLALCMSTVWADMGAPEVKPYKAYISNFDGAEYFNYDTRETLKLDYGTKIYVIYEDYYSQDNIVYVTAQVGVEHEQMGAPYLQIKLSDISIINGAEVIPDNLATITKDKAIFKTKKSGAEMKKGPAEVYESTGTMVPDGADITIYDYASYEAWKYVEYNGKSGWIKRYDGDFYLYPKYQEIMTLDNVRMQQSTENGTETVKVVPAGTKIEDYMTNGYSYFFTYDGCEGYLYETQVVVEEKGIVKVGAEGENIWSKLEVVEDPETEMWDYPSIAKNIPKGTNLPYEYRSPNGEYYYVEYEGQHGWITSYENVIEVEKNAKLRGTNTGAIPTQEVARPTQAEPAEPASPEKSGKQIVWMCIAVAVIIAITVVVTLALVNKKR